MQQMTQSRLEAAPGMRLRPVSVVGHPKSGRNSTGCADTATV